MHIKSSLQQDIFAVRSLIHMKFSNDVLSSLYGVAAQCEHLCGIVLEHQNLSRTCRQRAFS